MDLDGVRKRISQLLKVAENSAATPGEVENALRAARNLMMAYHVEESDVVSDQRYADGQMGRAVVTTHYRRIAYWEKLLSTFVSKLLGGVGVYCSRSDLDAEGRTGGHPKPQGTVIFFGLREEVELAKETYVDLSQLVRAMATSRYGGAFRGDGGVYAVGFATGLIRQLETLDQQSASGNNELVERSRAVTQAKLERAHRWLREQLGIHLATSRQQYTTTGTRAAHAAGVRDGRNHDLSGLNSKSSRQPSAYLPHHNPR